MPAQGGHDNVMDPIGAQPLQDDIQFFTFTAILKRDG